MTYNDDFITINDKSFILKALKDEVRVDGRKLYDYRKLKFSFSLDDCSCTLAMGSTRVMSVVAASLESPFPDRPNEGSIRFNVELSPMASPFFEAGRPGEEAIELARLVERGLRQSHAIDQEALCVLAGRKVWALRVDCHVLDHGGNLVDACCLAALAALMAFRKPEVTVGGHGGSTEIKVHAAEEKEPLPLTIHHLPIAVTFGFFEDGNTLVVDPSLKEEAAMQGSATIMVNPNREVCAVHKAGGVGLSSSQLFRCVRLASARADEVVALLKSALDQHEVARVQARVRRHRESAANTSPAVQQEETGIFTGATSVRDDLALQELREELGLAESEDEIDAEDTAMYEEVEVKQENPLSSAEGQQGSLQQTPAPLASSRNQSGAGTSAHGAKLTTPPQIRNLNKDKKNGHTSVLPKAQTYTVKRLPEVKYYELEAIAAVIAGAGQKDNEEVRDLSDAVKEGPYRKKK
ncbi:hypothetical protein CEUSTIGMA_g7218.t1 [Chlamydomonas eustigma]|uniref:Exosome complex component RRP45 n=1 Tax=Chlamydomonas eustigma TaxID=1157962 RepID=A0A250X9M9_9CHLO|nr:hypothetical protein CEUSTIGMA_g7218.t1 [Chlamydomonas eustigma]|eukprot:GAX79778.1 hypothetical protein CEUSTIGMA_g7218.t1 [Chlamydomonas eustigma]